MNDLVDWNNFPEREYHCIVLELNEQNGTARVVTLLATDKSGKRPKYDQWVSISTLTLQYWDPLKPGGAERERARLRAMNVKGA